MPIRSRILDKVGTAKILKVFSLTLLLYALTFTLYATSAYAACDDPDVTKRGPECPAGLDQIEQMVGNIISVVVGLGFIVMLTLLVWAGFNYLTSGGEPKTIQAAHAVTTWALLGLLFMAIAWLTLQLIRAFTGVGVTVFDIKTLCDLTGNNFCKPRP